MSFEFSPDSLATCPFDPDHKIAAHKLQSHIIKCKRSHPELERQLVTCPFNASHLILVDEKEKHIMNCIDKDRLSIKRPRHIQTCEVSVPIYENYVHNPEDEDWDEETDIDVLQPALGIRATIKNLDFFKQRSIIDEKSDITRSFSQSSISTLNEQKISRGRGQMLKINESKKFMKN